MPRPLKKDRLKPRMAPNAINLRTLELDTAKRDPGRLMMPSEKENAQQSALIHLICKSGCTRTRVLGVSC
ncbi:MAG: hypothetical protein LUQ47_03060, partial [Methanotrichaceae archaeon]|nr:hypothetical protein [Methanotrichaceae archaeon]